MRISPGTFVRFATPVLSVIFLLENMLTPASPSRVILPVLDIPLDHKGSEMICNTVRL